MLGTQDLLIFICAGLLLNMTPGPDTFYILGRTVAQGRMAGFASVFGISTGCICHSIAAALGLSAVLATSATCFIYVKLVGAGYLVYLGVRLLLDRSAANGPNPALSFASAWTIYRQAVLTNVLNPKVALFFMAFLPQFVSVESPNRVLSLLFLGVIFVCNGTLYCLGLVWLASAISPRFQRNGPASALVMRLTGIVFVALGLRLAATK
jgi:threonine/homoserine/homoserine lactone efflux protein